MDIIVTGSLAYDRVMDFPGRFREHILPDNIHILNVSFTLDRFADRFGGTGGNVAYNLKLLGFEPKLVAAVGNDFDRYSKRLKSLGIDTSQIAIFSKEQTAVANIITDLDDNQISAFFPGATSRGVEVDLPVAQENEDVLLVVAPSTRAEIAKRCMEASNRQWRYIFGPGQQVSALSKEELRYGAENSILTTFNDYEWQLFCEKTGWQLSELLNRGITVVVTRGHAGSNIYTGKQHYFIPIAQRGEVKDPTGAGDAYLAGIAAGMVKGWDWQVTGQVAATIASFAVEHRGTQEHRFTIEMFNDRYGRSFGSPSPFNNKNNKT